MWEVLMAVPPIVRFRRRGVLAVVAAICALLLAAPAVAGTGTETTAAPAPAAAAAAAVPQLSWSDCGGGFQCATAAVPLDYDHPSGTKISLALIRHPATDQAHKLGSVFLNPGGPGGSGVDFVRGLGDVLFSDQVRAQFDLVGFDPRGIIGSTPLRCFDSLDQAVATLAPFPFPVTPAEERVWQQSDRALASACAKNGGAIMNHMASADAARDLDLLRQAVGDKKLTYVGYSYGTFLGQTYANLFPDKVRSLVIDGVLDPIAWTTGRGGEARTLPFSTRLHSGQGADATLGAFFRLCKQGGPNCAFSQGDPAARYARLAKRLLAHPAQLPDGQGGTITITYADLVAQTLGALYDSSTWPLLAEALQQLDEATKPQATAAAVKLLRTRLGAYQQDYPNLVEGFPGVACSDSVNPSSPDAWAKAAAAADRANPYFGRVWTWISSICQPWPGHDADRYLGPFSKRTANPVLVVSDRFDPATRYQGGVIAAKLLPSSRLLTLNGYGHTSLFQSSCADGFTSQYLLTSQVPPAGTVCQVDVVPFSGPAAAPAITAGGVSKRAVVIPPVLRETIRR